MIVAVSAFQTALPPREPEIVDLCAMLTAMERDQFNEKRSNKLRDFIDYGGLFVGNIADIAIVGGAGLLLWLVFTNIGIDGSRPQHAAGHRHQGGDR